MHLILVNLIFVANVTEIVNNQLIFQTLHILLVYSTKIMQFANCILLDPLPAKTCCFRPGRSSVQHKVCTCNPCYIIKWNSFKLSCLINQHMEIWRIAYCYDILIGPSLKELVSLFTFNISSRWAGYAFRQNNLWYLIVLDVITT